MQQPTQPTSTTQPTLPAEWSAMLMMAFGVIGAFCVTFHIPTTNLPEIENVVGQLIFAGLAVAGLLTHLHITKHKLTQPTPLHSILSTFIPRDASLSKAGASEPPIVSVATGGAASDTTTISDVTVNGAPALLPQNTTTAIPGDAPAASDAPPTASA